MQIRADHVAGAAFILFGALIIALSGDLPTGQLSMPGAGFMPKILAVLMIVMGAILALRAGGSVPLAEVGWSDGKHAALVCIITAIAVGLYTELGFIITLTLMIVALLVIVERRNALYAVGYSLAVVLLTFVSFQYFLKTPMPQGPFGF